MKMFSQNSFKSLAFASAVALMLAAPVHASTCTDACWEKARLAGQAAATAAANQMMNQCLQMAPGPARDSCFGQIQQAANGAYGQAFTQTMNACYAQCASMGQL